MTAALDRQAFFNAVRAQPFDGALKQGQVSGMQSLLDACPPDLGTQELAYCLATAFHETARTMLPIREIGSDAYLRRMYDPQGERPATAKILGNTVPGDGVKFCGRGYVQLTGRTNYRRATGELQNAGYLDRTLDLTVTPNMAMTPDIAAAIMFLGMSEGWFTGKKLSHYFGASLPGDPVNARRIINGTDKASTIAGYHAAFLKALNVAGHVPGAAFVKLPTPPVAASPLPPLVAPAPRRTVSPVPPVAATPPPAPTVQTGGLWSTLKSLFGKKAA